MDDLIAFLRDRLHEDELASRATADSRGAPVCYAWAARPNPVRPSHWEVWTEEAWLLTRKQTAEDAAHIARHDPARVLAEVDAKRRTLARHVPERRRLTLTDEEGGTTSFGFYVCTACTPNRTIEHGQNVVEWPCPDVRALALPYADHADYRDAWRP
ncbi:DUF6221 family protein [Streptomyces sp. NPDC059352]|uniref:DUF6221 family protein n=1 Tax=Streptomyces sp. NPDC059352 TaxID=3346810 RepID=UPI0036779A1D